LKVSDCGRLESAEIPKKQLKRGCLRFIDQGYAHVSMIGQIQGNNDER
jgi:hypothetical protein